MRITCLVTLFTALAAVQAQPPAEKPARSLADAPPRPSTPEPVKPEQLQAAIRRGVDFLLKDQSADGSWGTPERTKGLNIYAPVPGAHDGFRAAVTSLCISAMIEVNDPRPESKHAIERAENWLMDFLPRVKRATPDALYNIWAHGYAIQALVRMHGRLPEDAARKKKIEELIRSQLDYLGRYESVDGGWGYYDFRAGTQKPASDSTSFQTGAVLVALAEARQLGIDIPPKLSKAAVDSLIRQQKPDFTYLYGEYLKWMPVHPINRPGGSLGRSQCCNVALRLWGDKKITDEVLCTWLDRLITRNGWLDMGRKRPIPHESHFAVAGYFYYYGHYYAALCIDQLPAEQRPFYQHHLAGIIMPLQEKDGSWWDYPLYNYHQQYGTAFALMTLKRCEVRIANEK